ncbi:MAG: nicotinamide riboside transporter PnuC [Burkholderiales bacterium]|nr:MAG: nicotinamide riboside transporter PnuC [Burkholderiales bacterium]TAG79481.1 MAG: nicotinamide riboside transporter PnuC [Betaproteobacteria bacterium]
MLATAFHFFGAAVSWLEVVAFVLALAMVICSAYEKPLTWPLAIVSSALYVWLFYVSKLYGETIVNVFFVLSGLYGWFQWLFGHRDRSREPLRVARLPSRGLALTVAAWAIGWLAFGAFLARFTDSDVPWADAFVTAGSFVGTVLLAKKYIENWPVWIVVNAASVALFIYKSLWLTTLLYAILFAFSFWGWRIWRRALAA